MKAKMKKLIIGLFFIVFVIVLLPTLLIMMDREEVIESDNDNDNEVYDPYMKNWESYNIHLSGPDGYYVLNYTIEVNWVYLNSFSDTAQESYPKLYVVPSILVENFTEAWLNERHDILGNIHPILEQVYNIITYPRWYGYHYNFTAPYLDNWFIFLCCQYGGWQQFTYHDAIYYRP